MPITPRAAVFVGGFLALVAASLVAIRAGHPAIPFFVMPAVVLLTVLYLSDRLRALPHERRRRRRANGLCAHCGYDLSGNVSGVCPECGKRRNWL